MSAVLVAVGAAVGAVLRFVLSIRWDHLARSGTLAANTLGSFVIGLAAGARLGTAWWTLVAIGFCGALTTWSSMTVQAVDDGWRHGSRLLGATLVLAIGAAWLGYRLAS